MVSKKIFYKIKIFKKIRKLIQNKINKKEKETNKHLDYQSSEINPCLKYKNDKYLERPCFYNSYI